MEEYRHLRVYQASLDLVGIVAELTRRFPHDAGKLRKQLDDAVDGIGSNIAEGCGRKNKHHSNGELIRYLSRRCCVRGSIGLNVMTLAAGIEPPSRP